MSEARTTRAARDNIDYTMMTGARTAQGGQEGVMAAVENARDLNLRLIDMVQANTEAAFDFAREIAEAKTPSDFVEVWTATTTKQFDMLTKQVGELTRLGQRFAEMPGLARQKRS